MPKQILFVQGGGESVHDQWDNALVNNLRHHLGAAYDIIYPRMPDEADPQYATWKPALLDQVSPCYRRYSHARSSRPSFAPGKPKKPWKHRTHLLPSLANGR